MMCCCDDYLGRYAPVDTAATGPPGLRRGNHQHEQRGTSDFPGQRRLVKTAGNALQEAPPEWSELSLTAENTNNTNTPPPRQVAVTVPEDVFPGQTIHVNFADGGESLTLSAVVPPNVGPGSQFLVDVPPPMQPSSQSNAGGGGAGSMNAPAAPPAPAPIFEAVPIQQAPTQRHLKVEVPPGVAPGATIVVHIPGENRTLQAVVPPNVTEFYVAYDPLQNSSTCAPPATPVQQPPPRGQDAQPFSSIFD